MLIEREREIEGIYWINGVNLPLSLKTPSNPNFLPQLTLSINPIKNEWIVWLDWMEKITLQFTNYIKIDGNG